MTRAQREGALFLAAFVATVPAANWMIQHVGTVCTADGPCLVPVGGGLMAPSGVLAIGLAFVLRDLVQRRLGPAWGVGAIAVGAALSAWVAPAALVAASAAAFLLSELADFAVYTPLARRRFVLAVALSSTAGLVMDSLVFLWLAFGDLTYLPGQVVGKAWMVLLAMPVVAWLRAWDRRRGLAPAG